MSIYIYTSICTYISVQRNNRRVIKVIGYRVQSMESTAAGEAIGGIAEGRKDQAMMSLQRPFSGVLKS